MGVSVEIEVVEVGATRVVELLVEMVAHVDEEVPKDEVELFPVPGRELELDGRAP